MALGDLIDPPAFSDDEVFIRRFKDPATRVRFMPAFGKKLKGTEMVEVYGTEAWPSELAHFKRGFPGGMMVCIAPHGGTCGACSDPDPKVRKRSRAWFCNALDDEGNVRIYTMGIKLKELLEAKESRHPSGPKAQPLSMRDFIIYRIKGPKGEMDVTYDPDAQDPEEIDFSDVDPIAITPVLEKKVEEVHDFYFGSESEEEREPVLAERQSEPDPVTTTKKGPIRPKPRGAVEIPETTVAENTAEYGEPDPSDKFSWGDHPDAGLIEMADNSVIKGWLDEQGVEPPARITRAKLIALAVATATE